MTHGLQIGTLDLVDGFSDEGYELRVLADGASFGSPEAKVKQIVSALADGDLVSYDRAGNRVVEFSVQITAPDGVALAAGEAALRRELYRPNTVTWTPPSSFSPPTVFDVLTSEGQPSFNDLDEIHNRRIVKVTLTCAPHARSATFSTVAALAPPPAVPTTATVNDADSTTDWSATISTYTIDGPSAPVALTVTDQGAYVRAQGTGTWPSVEIVLAVAATDMTTTPYLQVEMSGDAPSVFVLTFNGGSLAVAASPILTRATPAGTTLYVFDAAGMAGFNDLSGFKARRSKFYAPNPETVTLNVHDVTRTDTLPQVTARQVSRTIEVGGTERTPGSIHVSSENGIDPLELAIVHTCPEDGSGYSPPLRRWRVSGEVETPSATALSGFFEDIAVDPGGFVAEVPTSALPEGGYVLCARMHAPGGTYPEVATLAYSTSTIFPDSTTQQGYVNGTVEITFPDADWIIVPVAVLSLPSVRTAAGHVQIVLQVTSTDHPNVYLDEAWLFRADDDCALTIVETDQPHLWLDSPDITSPVPRVWVGDSVETRVHPGEGLHAQGAHVLSADGTTVFTAALTDWAAVDASFYRRYHSNAAT